MSRLTPTAIALWLLWTVGVSHAGIVETVPPPAEPMILDTAEFCRQITRGDGVDGPFGFFHRTGNLLGTFTRNMIDFVPGYLFLGFCAWVFFLSRKYPAQHVYRFKISIEGEEANSSDKQLSLRRLLSATGNV